MARLVPSLLKAASRPGCPACPPVRVSVLLAVLAIGGLIASRTQASTLPFARYTEAEGAPTSTVMGVAQGDSGRIWFASRLGVLRYDGADWTIFDATHGLPTPAQRDVAVDHRGGVWSLSQMAPARICRLEADRWIPLSRDPGSPKDAEATELIAGCDADGGVALAVLFDGGQVLVQARERWWPVALPDDSGTTHSITWHGSDLLVAAAGGLYRQSDPGREGAPAAARVPGLPGGPVYAAVIHPGTGALFVAGEGWFGELAADRWRPTPGAGQLRVLDPDEGVEAAIDALGGLYIGNNRALLYLHPLFGLETVSQDNGLVSGGVTDILVDREGNVWLTNLRGVNKLASRRLERFKSVDGLLDDEVTAVLQRHDGSMILGHHGGLTFMEEGPRGMPLVAPGQEWSRVMDLYEDTDGALWAAMDRSGLARLDRRGGVRWYGPAEGIEGAAYAVLHDREGRLWVGTAHGLRRQAGERFERIDVGATSLPQPLAVRRLYLTDDGALLAGTARHGVARVVDDQAMFWSGDEGTGRSSVFAMYSPSADDLWVGTAGGLCRLRGGRIEPTAAPDPVITEPVYAITPDDRGRVWFGTSAGVLVWDGLSLRRFGVVEGLSGAETNRDALLCDADGRMWIGTDRGLNIHDERLAGARDVEIPLWITTCETDGVVQPAGGDLRLPADTYETIVRFCAPAFADEARLRFSIRMEGSNDDWSAPAPNPSRSVRYTNLPPGRYRFQVRAVDIEGRTSAIASSGIISVSSPLRQQAWFRVLEFAVLAGLVWLVGSLVLGRRYNRRLAAEVSARTAELARSEAAVRTEARKQGAILASISDGVIALGPHGEVTLANPAAAVLSGHAADAMVGRAGDEVLPGIIAAARAALEAARGDDPLEPGPPAQFELRLPHAGGDALSLECAVAPLAAGGIDAGLVLAFRDTTERRRAEQAVIRTQKLESLGVLAGGIAHDFNNLLTVIMGNASLLELECPPEQRRSLTQIGTAAVRAQRLTAQLLTFARGGSPQKRLTNLRTLLREAATLAVAGTNVSLELDVPEDLWDADVDPGQFEQVVSNLLINARQAMPQGGRVWITARNTARTEADGDAGPQVEIRIRDEGCGIAPAHLERIFEPYFTTKDAGTGLGLAISHSVIARHGGAMRVASLAGRGAEFTLLLPASRDRFRTAAAATAPAVSCGRRVLVLDDEAGIRQLLSELLGGMGHEVVAVSDGAEALNAWTAARLAGRPFATAIMDLTIPGGLGGREAMARLSELEPGARTIVTSGYSEDPVMADHRRYGFAAKLAKPFGRDEVARALIAALD